MLTEFVRDAAATDGTAFDEDTSMTFGIVVGIEFVLAGAGAALLRARRKQDVTPVWIALVVGLHLFPVAAIIAYPLIHVAGALVTVAALAAIPPGAVAVATCKRDKRSRRRSIPARGRAVFPHDGRLTGSLRDPRSSVP